jgi:hypothetical protein
VVELPEQKDKPPRLCTSENVQGAGLVEDTLPNAWLRRICTLLSCCLRCSPALRRLAYTRVGVVARGSAMLDKQ